MKKLVEWRVFLTTLAVVAAIAFGASYLLGLSFLPLFVRKRLKQDVVPAAPAIA